MSVSVSYAKALYEAAKDQKLEHDELEKIEGQLDLFITALEQSKELRIAVEGPLTYSKEKVGLIQELSKKLNCTSLVQQFLTLLAKKGRLSLLKEVRDSFSSVRLIMENGIPGKLVSAEPISDTDVSTLAKAFSQKLGKKVSFRVSTDPSLLAGIKVTVNGVTYDGTLRSQLQKLRDHFVAGNPGAHA